MFTYHNMNIKKYQKESKKTEMKFKNNREKLLFLALGLSEEAGELDHAVKVFLKTKKSREKIKDSLADILWYIAEFSNNFDWTIEYIASNNRSKLKKRYHEK